MKTFRQYYRKIEEALTIPENPSDKTEVELRKKLGQGYEHSDRIIRWYRNARKSGEDQDSLQREFVRNLGNIKDLLKTYDEYLKKMKQMKLLGKKITLDVQGGKKVDVDPVKDIDKIRKLRGFRAVVEKMGEIVHSDTSIDTGNQKYQITEDDREKICLLGVSQNVMMWQTQGYETTNKFVFQLWQNDKTIGRGDVYGDPSEQTPYCTHSKQHWDDYSEDFGDKYRQFWFLEKVDGVEYSAGDLNNKSVIKAFNAMKGLGPKLLIAMNDSGNDMLDRNDESVNGWEYAVKSGKTDEIAQDIEYADQVLDLQRKFTPITYAKRYPWQDRSLVVGDNGVPASSSLNDELLPSPEYYRGDEIIVSTYYCDDRGFENVRQFVDFTNKMKFPRHIDVDRFILVSSPDFRYNLNHPPSKIIAPHKVVLQNIDEISNPIEIHSQNITLDWLSQNVCDKLVLDNEALVQIINSHLQNIKFLPDHLPSLDISTSIIQSFNGAPVSISELGIRNRNNRTQEYKAIVNVYRLKDYIRIDKWIENRRFRSLITDDHPYDTISMAIKFLSWLGEWSRIDRWTINNLYELYLRDLKEYSDANDLKRAENAKEQVVAMLEK